MDIKKHVLSLDKSPFCRQSIVTGYKEVCHVLKIRISASLEDRVREEMLRENIPADEARLILVNDDAERR